MKNNKRYLLQVHGAVLLFGLSGLFGKLDQPAMVITLGRVVFSALFLLVLLNLRHIPYRVSGRQLAALAGLLPAPESVSLQTLAAHFSWQAVHSADITVPEGWFS